MKDQVRVNVVAMEKFFCSLVLCFLITFAMKSYNSGLHFRNQFEGKYLLCEWHQVDASWMCVCVCGGGGIFIHYGPLKLVVATSEVVAALVFSILVTSVLCPERLAHAPKIIFCATKMNKFITVLSRQSPGTSTGEKCCGHQCTKKILWYSWQMRHIGFLIG